jgi:hypothetical protein
MPELNRPLVEKIITQLIDHPELHDQTAWMDETDCGTSHCVAGWAIAIEEPSLLNNGIDLSDMPHRCADGTGRIVSGWTFEGARLLGLDVHFAQGLFTDFGDTDHMVGRLKDLLNEG